MVHVALAGAGRHRVGHIVENDWRLPAAQQRRLQRGRRERDDEIGALVDGGVDHRAHRGHVAVRVADVLGEIASFLETGLAQTVEHTLLGFLDVERLIQLDQVDAPRLRDRTPGRGGPRARRRRRSGFAPHAVLVDDDRCRRQDIGRHLPRLLEAFQRSGVDREVRRRDVLHVANRHAREVLAGKNVGREQTALAPDLIEVGPGVEQGAAIRLAGQDREDRNPGACRDRDDLIDAGDDRVVAADPDRLRVARE